MPLSNIASRMNVMNGRNRSNSVFVNAFNTINDDAQSTSSYPHNLEEPGLNPQLPDEMQRAEGVAQINWHQLKGRGKSQDVAAVAQMAMRNARSTNPLTIHNPTALMHNQRNRSQSTSNCFQMVSTDILRASGFGQPFKNLLSTRKNSDSVCTDEVVTLQHQGQSQDSNHRAVTVIDTSEALKCNGGAVNFVTVEHADNDAVSEHASVRVIRRRTSRYGISITSDSTAKMRCRIRKQLFTQRISLADIALVLACIGIALTIIDTELTARRAVTGIGKYHWLSLSLRFMGLLSTLALLVLVFMYHSCEVKIALIDSGADDWRVAITTDRIIQLIVEMCVCAICPIPGTSYMWWPYVEARDSEIAGVEDEGTYLPVDTVLSVPMFLRAYLLGRFMVLHSRQFQDAATRSIAALNRISMDFRFVVKTMMAEHPLRVLIVFTLSYWMCMSWMFAQCERYHSPVFHPNGDAADEESMTRDYLNSVWFVMVTFMSIGYGDVVPSTYCGRTLSIMTGIVGAGVSSALIAVMSRKLELSRAEKHVNNFVSDSKLTNQRKNAAASVLQHTWFIHKYKKSLRGKTDDIKVRYHQRKFLQAITEFRRIKWDQRKLAERGNSLLDVGKMHNEMHETLWEMHHTQDRLISQVDTLTQRIVELQQMMNTNNTAAPAPTVHTPKPGSVSQSRPPHIGMVNQTQKNSSLNRSPLRSLGSYPEEAEEQRQSEVLIDDQINQSILDSDYNNRFVSAEPPPSVSVFIDPNVNRPINQNISVNQPKVDSTDITVKI